MVEGDCVDDHEVLQVVLVGCVVPVPGHHVKWRVVLQRHGRISLNIYPPLISFLQNKQRHLWHKYLQTTKFK